MKLILFDCDETLWTSENQDYISSVLSSFRKINNSEVLRVADKKIFKLRLETKALLSSLKTKGQKIQCGVVSDNIAEPVIEALNLFGLMQYFNPDAINVRLWKGPCPKEVMIAEILAKSQFKKINKENVYLVDDKDYSDVLKNNGMNFIQIRNKDSLRKRVLSQLII